MFRKMMALVLGAMLMAGSMTALAETVPAPEAAVDAVLATFNGESILKSEADAMIPQLGDYMADATDYQYVVETLVRQRVMAKKIKDMGFDVFTQEEMDAFARMPRRNGSRALRATFPTTCPKIRRRPGIPCVFRLRHITRPGV